MFFPGVYDEGGGCMGIHHANTAALDIWQHITYAWMQTPSIQTVVRGSVHQP